MGEEVNATEKPPVSMEGMIIAYGSLMVMAVLPIFLGSLRSVKFHHSKVKEKQLADRLTSKDAMMFPFLASGVLLVLYTTFKIFSKETINMLITGYFYFLGVVALCHLLSPIISKLIPGSIPNVFYRGTFGKSIEGVESNIADYTFSSHDVISFLICCVLGLWYLLKKHWIANNLFGMAFAINGIEMLLLNKVTTAFILLCGLFVYDIFWVFYTDVMVTVAKSFEAPIKLVFPQDFFENGIYGNNFAMLGLGDIVIPGIFIALLLRFDKSLKREKNLYFSSTLFAYIFGLSATILVMHTFKHAQPALLYLVPACVLVPVCIALVKGDLSAMLSYEDYPGSLEKLENAVTSNEVEVSKESSVKNASASSPSVLDKKKN